MVARLIRDTYCAFNLDFLPPGEQAPFLGPFQHADSPLPEHQRALERVIASEIVLVAEEGGQIVGVLRGRVPRLGSLFVRADYHRQGIATRLVRAFEDQVSRRGGKVIRVASTLYAVPFYLKMGYKRSTGVRSGWSFDGRGLPIQPMRRVLESAATDLLPGRICDAYGKHH
jgi:GNAT superfamily N-acetyltransferase